LPIKIIAYENGELDFDKSILKGKKKMSNRDRFIVLVRSDLFERTFGVYRSFKAASEDAKAWNGIVIPLEYHVDAPRPWVAKANGHPTTNGEEPKYPFRTPCLGLG